jgi:hypothetical protein
MQVILVLRQFQPALRRLENVIWERALAHAAQRRLVQMVALDRMFEPLAERLPAQNPPVTSAER